VITIAAALIASAIQVSVLLVSRSGRSELAAPPPEPIARRQPAPSETPSVGAAPTPEPPAELTVKVAKRWHPVVAEVTSPLRGSLVRFLVADGTVVHKGRPIASVGTGKGRPRPKEVSSANLRELEKLAKQDPEYQVFLERERARLSTEPKQAAGGNVRAMTIFAPVSGLLQARVEAGTALGGGDLIAEIVDQRQLKLSAPLIDARPEARWSCSIALEGSDKTASCRLEAIVEATDGRRAEVALTGAPPAWTLAAEELTLRLWDPTRAR
jgi:multidrug efflux pump subunit AcrA (membrane-fusion protein)